MKDTKTVLLALLSLGLVCTWVYHLYEKSEYTRRNTQIITIDTTGQAKNIRDSLQDVYTKTILKLGTELDSTKHTAWLLEDELNNRLAEILRLRSEIAALPKVNYVARQRDDPPPRNPEGLKQSPVVSTNNNTRVEPNELVNSEPGRNQLENIPPVENQNTSPPGSKKSLGFEVSDLKIAPVTDKEVTETANEMSTSNKLVVSFDLKNNQTEYNNTEVFVVITQPNGKVFHTDIWENNSMRTIDGKKIDYTRKVKLDCQKGESKHLQFTIDPENYQKGNYSLKVYHNGYKIGETTRSLN